MIVFGASQPLLVDRPASGIHESHCFPGRPLSLNSGRILEYPPDLLEDLPSSPAGGSRCFQFVQQFWNRLWHRQPTAGEQRSSADVYPLVSLDPGPVTTVPFPAADPTIGRSSPRKDNIRLLAAEIVNCQKDAPGLVVSRSQIGPCSPKL